MYYILNKYEEVVGVLNNNNNSCPFYDDVYNWKIAEDEDPTTKKMNKTWNETLTLSAPIGYEETSYLSEGNYIVFQDHTGRWKEFTIYETKESLTNDGHVKTIQAFNSCIWNMSHVQIEEKKWTGGVKSQAVFEYIFANSQWRLSDFGAFYKGDRKEYSISGGTSQSALINALKEFEVEAQAYVVLENGKIIDHVVELVQPIGRDTALRFEYQHNLMGCTRTINDTDFFTKLYVFGGADKDGKPTTISEVNNKKPFLIDEEANNKYNGGREYREGIITNESILNKNGLLDWGKEQFKYYNHPHCTYEVDIALLEDDVQIGDEIVVIDREFDSSLQILARVIETNFSFSNPDNNKVTLGEFLSLENVTPDLIWQLKAQLEQELNKVKSWRVVIENLGQDSTTDDETTLLQAKIYYGEELMNSKIPANGIQWYERSYDTPNNQYVYIGTGFIIRGKYGCEYKAELSEEIKDMIESTLNTLYESDFKLECRLNNDKNAEGLLPSIKADFNTNIHQYVEMIGDNYYWLQNYTGKDHNSKVNAESYTITKTDKLGNILGRIKCINSCHGDEFSLKRLNDKEMVLYSAWWDNEQKEWSLVALDIKDEDFLNDKAFYFKDCREMFKYFPSWQPRIYRDKTTGNFIVERGRGDNEEWVSIWDWTVEYEGQGQYLYDNSIFQISNFNLTKNLKMNKNATLQSLSMKYPYIYAAYGQENALDGGLENSDQPTIVCYDFLGNTIFWKVLFNFGDNIKPLKEGSKKNSLETINYSLIDDENMNIFVSFDFEGEREGDNRVAILYKAIQKSNLIIEENNPFRCTKESYYQKGMNDLVKKIEENKWHEEDQVILFDTDAHLQYNTFRSLGDIEQLLERQMDSYNIVSDLTRMTRVDMIVLGGDMVDGSGLNPQATRDSFNDLKRIIDNRDKKTSYIYTIGNHDYNGFFAQSSARSRIGNKKDGKPKDLKDIVLNTKDIVELVKNDELNYTKYGSVSFIKNNILYIALNSQDCGYKIVEKNGKYYFSENPQGTVKLSVAQLNWLSKTLFDYGNQVKSIIISVHQPLEKYQEDKIVFDVEKEEHAVINAKRLTEIITNYNELKLVKYYEEDKNGLAINPTKMGLGENYAKIQLMISGHIHRDRINEGSGTNSFSACCSMNIKKGKIEDENRDDLDENGEGYIYRVADLSVQRTSLKVIIVSNRERKIKVLNFGYETEGTIDNLEFNFL